MGKVSKTCLNEIVNVVSEKGVAVYFQPVVSLRLKSVIGFEALSRGNASDGESYVSTACLFNEELPPQAKFKVEQLCLNTILDSYHSIYEKHLKKMLFLNVKCELYCLEKYMDKTPLKIVQDHEFNPNIIVFEFDAHQLRKDVPWKMMKSCIDMGFKISIDNWNPNLIFNEHMFRINPDFVKLDRRFFAGIDSSDNVKRAVSSAAVIFRQIGAVPIVKGVETAAEALALAEVGFYVQQGYFYAKEHYSSGLYEKMVRIYDQYSELEKYRLNVTQKSFRNYYLLLQRTLKKLQQEELWDMHKTLERLAKSNPDLVSAFVLDSSGQRISKMVVGQAGELLAKKLESSISGKDHSAQDYFMYLNSGLEKCSGMLGTYPLGMGCLRYVAGAFQKIESKTGFILVIEYVDQESVDE